MHPNYLLIIHINKKIHKVDHVFRGKHDSPLPASKVMCAATSIQRLKLLDHLKGRSAPPRPPTNTAWPGGGGEGGYLETIPPPPTMDWNTSARRGTKTRKLIRQATHTHTHTHTRRSYTCTEMVCYVKIAISGSKKNYN